MGSGLAVKHQGSAPLYPEGSLGLCRWMDTWARLPAPAPPRDAPTPDFYEVGLGGVLAQSMGCGVGLWERHDRGPLAPGITSRKTRSRSRSIRWCETRCPFPSHETWRRSGTGHVGNGATRQMASSPTCRSLFKSSAKVASCEGAETVWHVLFTCCSGSVFPADPSIEHLSNTPSAAGPGGEARAAAVRAGVYPSCHGGKTPGENKPLSGRPDPSTGCRPSAIRAGTW